MPFRRRGFSLLELIAVMVVLAAIMAITAPALRGFAEGRRVSQAARSMLALIKWTRAQAINEGRPFRFHVTVASQAAHGDAAAAYYVTAQDGAAFTALRSGMGRRNTLPAGMNARWQAPGEAATVGYITIDATGRTGPAELVITDRQGHAQVLRCDAPGEPFRLADVDSARSMSADEANSRIGVTRYEGMLR